MLIISGMGTDRETRDEEAAEIVLKLQLRVSESQQFTGMRTKQPEH